MDTDGLIEKAEEILNTVPNGWSHEATAMKGVGLAILALVSATRDGAIPPHPLTPKTIKRTPTHFPRK